MSRPHPRILMCRPECYGIEYEINPWMSRQHGSDRTLALEQWDALTALLRGLGVTIELLEPRPGLPDMVFTANAGIVCRDVVVPARFRHKERQGESPYFERWFAEHGFTVTPLPDPFTTEGAGDALFCGELLFAGYIFRSEIQAHHETAALLGYECLSLELTDPRFYHLDTCFCPLSPGEAIVYLPAFDEYGRKVLADQIPSLIYCDETSALRFGCNAVVVGKHVVLNTGAEALGDQLARRGYTPIHTNLSEFIKAGGSAKCLTLRLDGEEAAPW